MTAKRKPTAKRASISNVPEHESAEEKVLFIWLSHDQIYGKRWSENFGNDPLGRSDAKNRMGQWIEAVGRLPWSAVREAVVRVRNFDRPYDGWLPDLQAFLNLAPKPSAPKPPAASVVRASEVSCKCHLYLIRFCMRNPTPIPKLLNLQMLQETKDVIRKYELVRHENPSLSETVYLPVLSKRLSKLVKEHNEDYLEAEQERLAIQSQEALSSKALLNC